MDTRPPKDEGFVPDAMVLEMFGALPPDDAILCRTPPDKWPDVWPESLPTGWDHILLRRMGLPCGADDAKEHYALLREPGGWRVWRVSELVNRTMEALEAHKAGRPLAT